MQRGSAAITPHSLAGANDMTLNIDLMGDQNLRGKRVLIREDLNVPIKNVR